MAVTPRATPAHRPRAGWLLAGCLLVAWASVAAAQEPPPALTAPVNDFAQVIDGQSTRALDALIRALQQASGDVVVVATVRTIQPYADIREYAVRMFENQGRGIGQQGRDNGLLVLLAVDDRQVWIEVGYDLEEFVTDGFAGEVSRQAMAPAFRQGDYGAGLVAGVTQIVQRIAARRNVTLEGVPAATRRAPGPGSGGTLILAIFVLFIVINALASRLGGGRRLRRGWGGSYGGWHSGVGPFGGGFGGGRSGGGGGGAGW